MVCLLVFAGQVELKGTSGLLFVMAGHDDGYYFLMVAVFLVAIVGYVGELVTTRSCAPA
jgi:hypothetical protein